MFSSQSLKIFVASAALCLVSAPCFAQQMPSPKEIDKRIQEELKKLPDATAELEGVCKFTYKPIPTSPKKVKELAGGALPPQAQGMNPDALIKQYLPMIQQTLMRNLKEAGTVEVTKAFKVRSKEVPTGKHKFGFAFKGTTILAMVISVKDQKPIVLKFKNKKVKAPVDELKIVLAKDKKKTDRFHIGLEFLYQVSKGRTPLKTAKS